MTLLFIEGFDHYSTAQALDKQHIETQNAVINTNDGRFGNGAYCTSNYTSWGVFNFGVDKSTIYWGTAFKKYSGTAPTFTISWPWFEFLDADGISQVKLYLNNDWSIIAYQGDDTLLGSSAAAAVENNRWQYLEAKITVSATVGEVTLKIDGTQILNLTSQDTKNGSDYIRKIRFRGSYNGGGMYWDDMYVDDAQFHGDCRVRTFMPDADGNSADFTRSTGSNDYECVDEAQSTEDTDYIVSDTLNHKSIFGITTGVLGTVIGIQLNNHCRLDEAGTRKIKPIIRSNSTDYQGIETGAIAADYHFESEVWELDPDDSGAWTQTKLEAAEFGLEITT